MTDFLVLHYILNECDSSLLRQFLEAQILSPVRGDWILTVRNDLEELEIHQTLEEIGKTSKVQFKEMVKAKIQKKAFTYLTELKETHSKVKFLIHIKLHLQPYLQSGSSLSIKEKQFASTARTRMLDLRTNFRMEGSRTVCRRCESAEETQEHLLSCPSLDTDRILQASPPPG